MGLKCLFWHKWDGCICVRCGKARDEQHDWDGCRCRRCGQKRNEQHDWDGCKCRRCGKTRDEQHDIGVNCVCNKCGQSMHYFGPNCVCTRCEQEIHDFSSYQSEHAWEQHRTCRRCGATERISRYRCTECDGAGYLGWSTCYNMPDGACYACGGEGYIEEKSGIIYKK